MKIRKFNESSNSEISEEIIRDYFANSIDACKEHEINLVYADPKNKRGWAHNDFSNTESEFHPDECITGYEIRFTHSFYDESEVSDFYNFIDLLNEIKIELSRFKKVYEHSDIFFSDRGNDEISMIIL
jgi:hypothetical protein